MKNNLSRRSFLKATGLAAAASVIPAIPASSKPKIHFSSHCRGPGYDEQRAQARPFDVEISDTTIRVSEDGQKYLYVNCRCRYSSGTFEYNEKDAAALLLDFGVSKHSQLRGPAKEYACCRGSEPLVGDTALGLSKVA